MPSHSSSVRLAPLDPNPRNEIPCVVGFAAILDDRRNKPKPGTARSRSSRSTPGCASTCERCNVLIDAGVSPMIVPVTVID